MLTFGENPSLEQTAHNTTLARVSTRCRVSPIAVREHSLFLATQRAIVLPQLPDPMMATECWRDDETWPLAPAPAPPAPAAPSSPPPDTLEDIGASNEASMLKQNATGRSVQQLNRNRNGNRSRTDSLCTPAPFFRHCLGIPDWPLANVFSQRENILC